MPCEGREKTKLVYATTLYVYLVGTLGVSWLAEAGQS
jgi:hypothetical protein